MINMQDIIWIIYLIFCHINHIGHDDSGYKQDCQLFAKRTIDKHFITKLQN